MDKKMDALDERIRLSRLFDYYGDLLKESRRELCDAYLSDDLSLSEIAEGAGISRQGVHDSLKRSLKQLEGFEEKLGLIKKSETLALHTGKIKELLANCEKDKFSMRIEKELGEIDKLF